MDDIALARRAVARGLMTRLQLDEAREIAAGGRSLLAILLEMGYLRVNDLEALFEKPPANRTPLVLSALALAVVIVVGGVMLRIHSQSAPAVEAPPQAAPRADNPRTPATAPPLIVHQPGAVRGRQR